MELDRCHDGPSEQLLQVALQGETLKPYMHLPIRLAQTHGGSHPRRDDPSGVLIDNDLFGTGGDPVAPAPRQVHVVVVDLFRQRHVELGARMGSVDQRQWAKRRNGDLPLHLATVVSCRHQLVRSQELRHRCAELVEFGVTKDGVALKHILVGHWRTFWVGAWSTKTAWPRVWCSSPS